MKNDIKTDARVTKSKKELYNALFALLNDTSFDKITVIDICKKAKVNRMTFYNHYEDKYDLFNDFINLVLNRIANEYAIKSKGYNMINDTYKCLTILAEIFVNFVYENKSILVNLTLQPEDDLAAFMLKKTFDDAIMKIISDTGLKSVNGYPIELIVNFFSGGCSSMFSYWLTNEAEITKEQFLAYVCRAIKAVIESKVLLIL